MQWHFLGKLFFKLHVQNICQEYQNKTGWQLLKEKKQLSTLQLSSGISGFILKKTEGRDLKRISVFLMAYSQLQIEENKPNIYW